MKKIITTFIFSVFFAVGAKAENFSDFALENINYADMTEDIFSGNIPEPVPADRVPTAARRSELKEWTVMVYSNSKDNLRYAQVWQMLDMKKIGSTDKVNVVIEAGIPIRYAEGVVSTTTVRIALGEGANPEDIDRHLKEFFENARGAIDYSALRPLAMDIVRRKKNEDMGDWRNIAAFTKWAKTKYPAKRYVFIIYGHGTGFFDQKKKNKGISIDTQTGNYVTLPEFSSLMKATGKVDVLVLQSCLMQMAEVAYQVKDYVDVMVGSSELMWSVGYDFTMMLDALNSYPNISNENLGKLLADSYVDRAEAYKLSGGHASVISISKLQGFVYRLDDWVISTMDADDKKSIDEGIKKAIRFDIFGITTSSTSALARRLSIAGDLYDFVDIVTKNLPQDLPKHRRARQKGLELMDYISNELVYSYNYTGKSNTGYDFSRAHGISIHLPPVQMILGSMEAFEKHFETLYWDLPFARESKWSDFLNWIYKRK